ncbi:hypothetical protein ACIPF8_22930 [Collimonas sp. NPDC087041]|uniref:hypothetical protein n=1 Tax=Collimonas sp. NPDC087041 TaxID=3363960 RepID=UPI0037F754EB
MIVGFQKNGESDAINLDEHTLEFSLEAENYAARDRKKVECRRKIEDALENMRQRRADLLGM